MNFYTVRDLRISECFPDLAENDIRELEAEVMQLA